MQDLKSMLGLNVCCFKRFMKNKCENLMLLINIYLLYCFGLQIYNYSYGIGYHCTNSILYMNVDMLTLAIMDLLRLTALLVGICFWCSFSLMFLDYIKVCKHSL